MRNSGRTLSYLWLSTTEISERLYARPVFLHRSSTTPSAGLARSTCDRRHGPNSDSFPRVGTIPAAFSNRWKFPPKIFQRLEDQQRFDGVTNILEPQQQVCVRCLGVSRASLSTRWKNSRTFFQALEIRARVCPMFGSKLIPGSGRA